MELLQLIIFSLCYTFMSAGTFFDTCLIYLFLRITYKSNMIQFNQNDPMSIMLNLTNIMLHLMVYQMGIMIEFAKQNTLGDRIISGYNILNLRYINLRNKVLHWILYKPMKFALGKVVGNLMDDQALNEIKKMSMEQSVNLNFNPNTLPKIPKTQINPDLKLDSNHDINNFLDGLLANANLNKKNN